jgi:hypothetical protein
VTGFRRFEVEFDLFDGFFHPIERRVMKWMGFILLLVANALAPVVAQDCPEVLREMKLPKKLKTRGKPKVLKWEDVDGVLNDVDKKLQGDTCSFAFNQLFSTKNKDAYFPLTNSVIRLVPEASLTGLKVFNNEGDELGTFAGKVRYERTGGLYARRSYVLYYFQFEDSNGQLQSVGGQSSQLLLDRFTVRWSELKGRVALSTE